MHAQHFIITYFLLNQFCAPLAHSQSQPLPYRHNQLLSLKEVSELPSGVNLRVRKKTKEVNLGQFSGLKKLSVLEYEARYDTVRKYISKKIMLPVLRETVTLNFKDGKTEYAEFLGFDYNTIRIRYLDKSTPAIISRNKLHSIVDINGYSIDEYILNQLAMNGEIPFRTVLLLKMNGIEYPNVIGLDEVEAVQIYDRKFGDLRTKIKKATYYTLPLIAGFVLGMSL